MASGYSSDKRTVQEAVIGELLDDIGAWSSAMRSDGDAELGARLGGRIGGFAHIRGGAMNAVRVPQSVVKRIANGGCHAPKELRRQMNYVLRDEANVASWSNSIGIDRSFDEDHVDAEVADWSVSWRGQPQRGHTDHIILSFPKNTDRHQAEVISREWGQEVFGSGSYRDRYRYVAALHHNTEHVHAHFIVDKRGMEDGKFLSISRYSEINYVMMKELHCQIAGEHGLTLNTTSRLSRGIIENAPRQPDIQAARQEGRAPYVAPLRPEQRAARMDIVKGHAKAYRAIAELARLACSHEDDPDKEKWLEKIYEGADSAQKYLSKGEPIQSGFDHALDGAARMPDLTTQMMAAQESSSVTEEQREASKNSLLSAMQDAWESIQGMESGAEKVQLENEFAETSREMAEFFPSRWIETFSVRLDRDFDPFAVGSVDTLVAQANDPKHPTSVLAQQTLADFREDLEVAFERHEQLILAAGLSVEELIERVVSAGSTQAQLDALSSKGNEVRVAWKAIETGIKFIAEDVYFCLSVDRELQVSLARDELLQAGPDDRLSDIPALDRLVGKLHHYGGADANPELARISSPTLRMAVTSELRQLDALETGQDSADRGSDRASFYQTRLHAEVRSRDRSHAHGDDDGYGL